MDWRGWNLEGWNQALVSTVFFDKERQDQPVKRIEASDKFLAKCTGDPTAKPIEAGKAFIHAFGNSPTKLRAYFAWSPSRLLETKRFGYPSIFAPLYLTLLAASADETTYHHGDFRDRFAKLIHPVDTGRLQFRDLPILWSHVREWSIERAKTHRDCRVLVLPQAPQYEKLIGHSKRLAFPAYRDEIGLQKALFEGGLDASASFNDVAHRVSLRLTSFSPSFIEEFSIFQRHASRAEYQAAYDTPFWGAVEAITWETQREATRSIGDFVLGVDVSDPAYPEFYLLADDNGAGKLPLQFKGGSTTSPGKHRNLILARDGHSWTPTKVIAVSNTLRPLARLKLWKRLTAGCLALFPDEYGNLNSEGVHYDGAPACILAKADLAEILVRASRRWGIPMAETKTSPAFAPWKVLLFNAIKSKDLQYLADTLPMASRQGLSVAWHPPKVTYAGGAWFGQALLLNPASVPLIGMRGIESGHYELLGEDGNAMAQGVLEDSGEDGKLCIPPKDLASIPEVSLLRVIAKDREGRQAESSVPVIKSFPAGSRASLPDPSAWLVDGPAGQLAGLRDLPSVTGGLVPSGVSGLPRLVRSATPAAANILGASLDDMPPVLDWLSETLALRFQHRAKLRFNELASYVYPASIAAGIPQWKLTKLLLSSGLLQVVQKRGSPYGLVAMAPRSISLHANRSGQPVARVSGLMSRSERAALKAMLLPDECAYRLTSHDIPLGLGVVELVLSHPDRIAKIAGEASLDLYSADSSMPPILLPQQLLAGAGAGEPELPNARDLEIWISKKRAWEQASCPQSPSPVGTCFRLNSGQRLDYWVATGSGYARTDSRTWLAIIRLALLAEPIGQVHANGDCTFHGDVLGLPPLLVAWWLHQLGGFIGISQDGRLVFAGSHDASNWAPMVTWFSGTNNQEALPGQRFQEAFARRTLALRLRARRP